MPKATRDNQPRLDAWLSTSRNREGSPSTRGGGTARSRRNELINRGRINTPQRRSLREVAAETKQALPGILDQLPTIRARESVVFHSETVPPLQATDCPRRTASGRAKIRVVNDDTFNAAAELAAARPRGGRVAVLNMASDIVPGGGWDHGAMAQEEELCYRSSLHLSLPRRHYPWAATQALYSPDVVVIRSDFASGHRLLTPGTRPADLPVVSVLSVAGLRSPAIKTVKHRRAATRKKAKKEHDGRGGPAAEEEESNEVVEQEEEELEEEVLLYADPAAREQSKEKMRLTLRMAARNDHGLLVLGALGCGAFRNPRHDVARCWLEVLREGEFQGGWWEEVWFAVLDRRREGNFELFDSVLGGEEV